MGYASEGKLAESNLMPGHAWLSGGIENDDQWIRKAALDGAGVPQFMIEFFDVGLPPLPGALAYLT
jgi:hypothetical protein